MQKCLIPSINKVFWLMQAWRLMVAAAKRLGCLRNADGCARQRLAGKKYDRKRPVVAKESAGWLAVDAEARQRLPPEVAPISVCNREANFFEFLHLTSPQSLRVVVRAKDRLVQGPKRFLFDRARGQPIAAAREITIEQIGQVDELFHYKRRDGRKR